MKFNQGEIATIYGYNWEELVEANDEGKMAYLRGKLTRLNDTPNLESFVCNLDLRNQKNFKKVILAKLAFLDRIGGE